MSVKLLMEEPVVARWGETMEEVGWGPWQYPTLSKADDGTIVLSCGSGADSSTSFGKELNWAVSTDDGRSWSVADPSVKIHSGTRLADGRIIRNPALAITPVPEEKLPEPIAIHPIQGKVFLLDDVREFLDGQWVLTRTTKDGGIETLKSPIDWPYYATTYQHESLLTPFIFGRLRLAPDGAVWGCHYGIIPSPENGGYSPYYNAFYLRSGDNGESWQLESWIPYTPDIREFSGAFTDAEGFCEADVAFLQDGSMVSLLRSGSTTPSYISRSFDGGKTWEKPEIFDKCGVWPCLLVLDCGVTVAGYGRPGFFLRATEDPEVRRWEDPIALIPYADRSGEANVPPEKPGDDWNFGTCSYCDMIALGEDEFLLAYSDFYYPDETGLKRKAVLTRRIKVVKE